MRKLAAVVMFSLAIALPAPAQRSRTTVLVLRINPESRLDPQQVTLRFQVSPDGATDLASQAAVIAAAVRPLPGQQIHVMARLAGLTGPDGAVPANALRWSGVPTTATGGGQQASCSTGVFASGAAQDLVAGWARPGRLTCSVNFELTDARSLPPGVYTGVVTFAVEAR